MASFNTSEGSWGDGLDSMKKQASRLAEDAALAHAIAVNGGDKPNLCDVCRQYVVDGKVAERVNGNISGWFHERCFKQAKFLNKHSDRL